MKLIEAIRQANQPGPPENSVALRVACDGAVVVAVAACASLHEISWPAAWVSMVLVSLGMALSYVLRARPPGWIKMLVAAAAVTALVWFFHAVSSHAISDITTVEDQLTVLFVCILVVHSFHVPSRRDLMFSLAASAGLMAVAAAQAINLRFGLYALAWVAFGLWSLIEAWTSASDGGRVSLQGLVATVVGVSAMAAVVFLVLPAPTVAARVNFLAHPGDGAQVAVPGALAGDAGNPAELSKPGSPSGPTRVGGYLGFADSLDTALRGNLGHTLVMSVRAQRPSYWVGETFDGWNGQSWTATPSPSESLQDGSPFALPVPEGDSTGGQTDLQTFYVNTPTADLVFHAETAAQVWFPASNLFFSSDGTMVSPVGVGRGAVYTVESKVSTATPAQLRAAPSDVALPAKLMKSYTQLPHAYPQAQALAEAVTAGDADTYDRVEALIVWIGDNTRYSTDIPALPPGADTVNEFLFGDRVGFCEQISTSLAVMLRTLGIPAREVVGYVPGPYNPITDLYEVQADDAHAWVQVWFPGYGWQSFDPTAVVPLANPSPGGTALSDVGHAFGDIPVAPVSASVGGVALLAVIVRWRRRRPASWAERVTRELERQGRRAGRPRRSSETFVEYAATLDGLRADGSATCQQLAGAVEAGVYSDRHPPPETQRELISAARGARAGRPRSAAPDRR